MCAMSQARATLSQTPCPVHLYAQFRSWHPVLIFRPCLWPSKTMKKLRITGHLVQGYVLKMSPLGRDQKLYCATSVPALHDQWFQLPSEKQYLMQCTIYPTPQSARLSGWLPLNLFGTEFERRLDSGQSNALVVKHPKSRHMSGPPYNSLKCPNDGLTT